MWCKHKWLEIRSVYTPAYHGIHSIVMTAEVTFGFTTFVYTCQKCGKQKFKKVIGVAG